MTYTESPTIKAIDGTTEGDFRAEREHPLANRATASWQTWG